MKEHIIHLTNSHQTYSAINLFLAARSFVVARSFIAARMGNRSPGYIKNEKINIYMLS